LKWKFRDYEEAEGDRLFMVMIVQMLCPKRHCLLACAYEEGVGNFAESCSALKAMINPGPFNDYCGICGSQVLHFEENRTRFKTLVEAAPSLTEQVMANLRTREVMDQLGMTYEVQHRN
jgi:hypothetical protein